MFQKKLEELQSVTKEHLDKLESAGYTTIESLSWLNPEELSEKTGIDFEIAKTIITEAISNIDQKPVSAADLLLKEEKRLKITTGSTELDKLLGGGIFTGEITEVSGEFATGKTQLCFQLCINVQLPPEQGGLEGGVYYIDTEGTFSSTRIVQMAQSKGLDPKKLLRNIAVTRTYNS
ncbi:MAG: DNA repair and recombination protein RadA, partial [Candidatus Heimdallarchaeota archaeon]|nr:DNA repair and recombination protein RadA [Candidatus Heimdallarchaeota archaeon]MCK4291177.1 DNA repair and recombination protein RadA [Candidatus Heimdallarchaeota archaeon]